MNYSLANHTLVFSNNTNTITIGNGSSMDNVNITYANDNFSYTMAADGTGTLNKNYMRNGTITISLQQTNPYCHRLNSIYNQQISSSPVDVGQVTIKDSDGNINGTYQECTFTKLPDYSAAAESSTRQYTIIFKKGIEE